jgi:NAD(P)H dehydrogenase (quinone)
VTFLRSAEHMQNWSRQIPAALQAGRLASLHHPVTKQVPDHLAARRLVIAAELLLEPAVQTSPPIIQVEGPRRYTALDVAAALFGLTGHEMTARELPRASTTARTGTRTSLSPSR